MTTNEDLSKTGHFLIVWVLGRGREEVGNREISLEDKKSAFSMKAGILPVSRGFV